VPRTCRTRGIHPRVHEADALSSRQENSMSDTVLAVQARFPERLLDEANALVTQGWFEDLDSVLQEALRRYLDAHRSELLDRFVREDVAWGLGGKD